MEVFFMNVLWVTIGGAVLGAIIGLVIVLTKKKN